MKKLLSLITAMAIVAAAGTSMAAGSATLNVSATVNGTCSIAGPGTLTFPLLDPTVAGASAAGVSSGITITCSNGTPYNVTSASLNGGNLKASLTADTIAYSLTLPPNGTGTGVAVAYNVAGNIAAGAFFGKPADVYADTVTLSITP